MKKLPLGMQGFREIIEGNYVYVDKTRYVYELLTEAKHCFLSRPIGFGKSLLLDTIAEVFNGDKELFKGLYIYGADYAFEKYPVIRLDMSNVATDNADILRDSLSNALQSQIASEGFNLSSKLPSDLFKFLIEALHRKYGKRVVVLIDEYDKPMLDRLGDVEIAKSNRDVLAGFYGVLKSMDPFLRFTFMTGISKFAKVSLFSVLNNLTDISMIDRYAGICGVPVAELDKYFGEHIEDFASSSNDMDSPMIKSNGGLRETILKWYDGYSWDGKLRVINPFSLLSLFMQKRFSGFWFATGSPRFLLDIIKEKPDEYINIKDIQMSEWALDSFDIVELDAISILFQTGYLTVLKYSGGLTGRTYWLDTPNFEVGQAFNLHIMAELTRRGPAFADTSYQKLHDSLCKGDLDAMLSVLKALFASIPYQLHINREAYYHSIFYAIMTVLGFDINAEISVSGGRIDATLELDEKVYIIEFKYKDCPPDVNEETKRMLFDAALDEGMSQIKSRGYAKKYESSGKNVYQAVFAFIGRDDIELRVW